MNLLPARLAFTLVLGLAAAAPGHAESSASSASSAGSASLGSVSGSVNQSSNSSSGKTQVAEGDYRVIELAELAARPGWLRLQLQAELQGRQQALTLDLPRELVAAQGLAVDRVVSVRQRPYGLEFAHAATREAFFLALADDWLRELEPRAVSL
jgi:hypothetical protein